MRKLVKVCTCAGYMAQPFSKEAVFTLEFRQCDPSFPAFLLGSSSLQEGHGCTTEAIEFVKPCRQLPENPHVDQSRLSYKNITFPLPSGHWPGVVFPDWMGVGSPVCPCASRAASARTDRRPCQAHTPAQSG